MYVCQSPDWIKKRLHSNQVQWTILAENPRNLINCHHHHYHYYHYHHARPHHHVALGDRFWLFIQTLNNDKNHSIQYSIQKLNLIIHSKNLFIQKLNQIIHSKNYSFKMDKTTQLEKTVKNRQKKPVLTSKGAFYSFFLWITHFFIHLIIHSIVRLKYSFKECIHSKLIQNYPFTKNSFIQKRSKKIHSKNLFIQKNSKLFIQRKCSLKLKMYYRPGLVQPPSNEYQLIVQYKWHKHCSLKGDTLFLWKFLKRFFYLNELLVSVNFSNLRFLSPHLCCRVSPFRSKLGLIPNGTRSPFKKS